MRRHESMSRKRRVFLVTVLALTTMAVVGTGSAQAGTGPVWPDLAPASGAAAPGWDAPARSAPECPPSDVVELSNVMWDNHVLLLQLRAEAAERTDEIRHIIQDLRYSGVVIPDDVKQAIKASRDEIRASQEAIRATVPEMQAERDALREDWQAKNWPGVLEHLGNIIEIQEVRIEEARNIIAELENIKALLEGLG